MTERMIEGIKQAWQEGAQELLQGEFFQLLRKGQLGLEHYKALLREIYYNSRENPQSFVLMSAHLRGGKRDLCPRIFRHCLAEYGHHDLALADLRILGEDVSRLPDGRPLPTTEALIAFVVYQVQHRNPVGYLGYIYHLEMLAARKGPAFLKDLEAMGIPGPAMGFLSEHAKVDLTHAKWMEEYLRVALETDDDFQSIVHVLKGTCRLHALMFQGILDSVAKNPLLAAA